MSRRYSGRELWDRMCEFVAIVDDGPVYECHPWTLDKLHFLCHYLAVTTTAMVGSRHFDSLNYVDLFSGSGVCRLKGQPEGKRYPGSPILAAGCEKPFSGLFLVDSNPENTTALRTRLARLKPPCDVFTWSDDANAVVNEIAARLPARRALNILFVDPFSLGVHFTTIESLARGRPMDLVMLFADAIDIVRNVEKYYYPNPDSKLDRLLGEGCDWRKRWEALQNREGRNVREFFAAMYLDQLRGIGYQHLGTRVIESEYGPMYRLVYASKHELGLKFWNIALTEDRGGERSLFSL